jgi:esterase/lipase superfamily enzyme
MGSLGRGLFGRIFKGDNRVKLQGMDIIAERQFWWLLANEVTALDASDQQGLIFLHGYNTKFEDAARRVAQLKVDLAHKGPAGFFSWPSLGYGAGYAGDEAAIEGSEPAIRDFLINFALRSGTNAVHIIAHSMGNRGLLRAMDAIANAAASAAPIRFGQVFLAAPDVDAQLFKNLAAAYGRLSTRATLYVTDNDKAIGLSRRLHRFARVGLAPPIAVVPGIDTIDASHVNLGLLGHSYAAEMRPVLSDIHRLMQGDTAPDHRFGLRRALGGKAGHWEFVP